MLLSIKMQINEIAIGWLSGDTYICDVKYYHKNNPKPPKLKTINS